MPFEKKLKKLAFSIAWKMKLHVSLALSVLLFGAGTIFLLGVCTAPTTMGAWSRNESPGCYHNTNNK